MYATFLTPLGSHCRLPLRRSKKLAALRLFVVKMPIQKAVARGNGNIEFYRETTGSNLK
jgi:hypothetical protein